MKKLSPKEVKKLNKAFKQAREIVVVAEHMQYARNVASLFRIADAIGVKKVFLTGVSHHPPFGKDLEKVSRGKEKAIRWQFSETTDNIIEDLRKDGFTIIAIEQVEGAKMYTEVEYPEKIAFVLGSEMHGMSKATAALVDDAVILPMFGKGGSINVHVAFAVVAFYASTS
jgi:tRNA G18 (ribose-2'-O)-methylase SpoU